MTPVMQIPLLDLRRDAAELDPELEDAFRRVLHSGRYILGPEVEAFESECASYVDTKHAIGVSSGSEALVLSLMALGIGAGDEVICPTYTFFATAGAIWRVGARPVFVDIDPVTYNCDPADIEARLSERTRAIIPVHLFGQCADMGPIVELASARSIPVIEDAAQALGAEYDGRRAGGLSTVACFSFFPSKNLGGLGDAGMITTNDDDLADRVRLLRAHGGRPKYHHAVVGGNFRIDALQAALLRVKLRRLERYTLRRQDNAAWYDALLLESGVAARSDGQPAQAPLRLPLVAQDRHIFNQYVLRVLGTGARDRLRACLADRGVATEIYYPVPMHRQPCFASLGGKADHYPHAEEATRQTLALPIFPQLSEVELRYVAEQLVACLRPPQESA